MATIMPEGEEIKKAINWFSENLEVINHLLSIETLVQQALFKFALSPVDAEFLTGFVKNRKSG